jgi:glycosyltransferase involved in cell wall biosynthesis
MKATVPSGRVLQVFSGLGIGGAETWLIALLRHFQEQRDHECKITFDICLTGGQKAELDDEAAALGAKLYYIKYSRNTVVDFYSRYKALLAQGYDAVHDHSDISAGFRYLLPARYLPPVRIAHVHNPVYMLRAYEGGLIRKLTLKIGRRLLAKRGTHILGTSRQVLNEYGFTSERFGCAKVAVVHCGFDVTRFHRTEASIHIKVCRELSVDPDCKFVLFVGNLDRKTGKINQKNPEFALELAKISKKENRNIVFVFAGAGKEKYESQVYEQGLNGHVRLLGARHDIPELMKAADLLIFPSIQEGLGMVAVEAQAAGLTVLASDAVPRETVVIPELISFLPLNDKQAWIDRIVGFERSSVISGDDAVRRLSQSPFSIEHSARALGRYYLGGR